MILFIVLKPTVYNGMRHYLFLEPIFCLIGTIGMIEFFKSKWPLWGRNVVFSLVGINIVLVSIQLFQLYPYQYIYFNELIGGVKGAFGKFETDYWGASLKEATQWLVINEIKDGDRVYKVKTSANPEQQTYFFKNNMSGNDGTENPDYYISLEDGHDNPLKEKMKIIYMVQREGVLLSYVLKK